MSNDEAAALIDCLTDEGYSWDEISSMLEKLKEHDKRSVRESVFESIGSGQFDALLPDD